ncbi:hypothetical protein ACHAWU_004542 [Discostella pseudostelligera]|uniref:Uncharacterized protein n=1 Tax=Discostella pseudostelligera TaxID=259834 RepID=A0ABD3MSV6_9STRA
MKSSSAIIACCTLLAGGAASTASSESAATAAATSRSASQNSSSSRRTERLRNRHNVYKSTLGSTNRASRRLGIFLPIPSPTSSTTNTTTTPNTNTTTTTATSSPTAAATRPSGIFGVGGTLSTSTSASSSSPSSSPSESPSDSTTVSDTPAPYYFPSGNDAPYTFGFDPYLSMMSEAPSTSPSNVPSSTGTTAAPTFKLTTIPPSTTGSPTEFNLSVDYDDDPFNFVDYDFGSPSMSMPSVAPSEAPSGVPTSTMAPSEVSPPPTAATLPVVEIQCEFCNEVSMDESIIIPFSNETTCGMAKEIVIQLNSTSEDCELARTAEAICCPKPATLNFTPAPTISWQPTEAPVPRPCCSWQPTEAPVSSSSVITTTLTMGVVVPSCLVALYSIAF